MLVSAAMMSAVAEHETGGGRPPPVERVHEAVDRWGVQDVVLRCASLLAARRGDDVVGAELELAMVLGGRDEPGWLAGGKGPGHAYFARVWAARALLYTWGDQATEAVIGALDDEQWRVREMAAKVVRFRELASAADRLGALTDDPVPRVRIAAVRALAVVGEGEHAMAVAALTDDPEPSVVRAATHALEELARRLDRPF
jgi:hypothetical protein